MPTALIDRMATRKRGKGKDVGTNFTAKLFIPLVISLSIYLP